MSPPGARLSCGSPAPISRRIGLRSTDSKRPIPAARAERRAHATVDSSERRAYTRPKHRRWRPTPPPDALVAGAPRGGLAAAVVALGFVAMLASSPGQSYWLALFVDDMIMGTGLSRTAFSVVYALATICSAFMVLFVGGLFDRRGPAVTWVSVACGLAAGGLLMSLATGPAIAIVGLAMLRAFGQGSFPLVSTLLVAGTFDAWRGRALSVAQLGSTLAAAALPAVAAALIATLGWRAGLQLTAAAVIGVIAPVAVLVRLVLGPRVPTKRSRRRLHPKPLVQSARERWRRFPWRDGGLVLLVTLSAAPLVSTAAVFHATSLLAASGLGGGEAAAALSVLAISGAAGAIAGGAVVDRLGVRVSLVLMNLLLAAGVGLLMVPSATWGFAGFAVLGLASGVNSAGSGAAWARTFGVGRLGELQSVGASARIGAAAVGPLPLAFALSLTGAYAAGLALLAMLALGCAAAGARLPRPVAEISTA
jgi:MFS family permease